MVLGEIANHLVEAGDGLECVAECGIAVVANPTAECASLVIVVEVQCASTSIGLAATLAGLRSRAARSLFAIVFRVLECGLSAALSTSGIAAESAFLK